MSIKQSSSRQAMLDVMAALRDPATGCPWDKRQTLDSIVPHTLSETYELADAIARKDWHDIKDELGDVLFQVLFYSQIAKEDGHFAFDDVAQALVDKLTRRHPHVFGNVTLASGEAGDRQLAQLWQQVKLEEKRARGNDDQRQEKTLNVKGGLPPLARALALQTQCAKVGFDWPDAEPVMAKVREECDEIEAARATSNQSHVEEEVGDLLFAVVNLARHLNVDPSQALIAANAKFEARFDAVESRLNASGTSLSDATLDTMEAAWQQVKLDQDN